MQSWGWCWSWSWLRMTSACPDTTPWTGSLAAWLWLQLSPVGLLVPESHVEAPARQSAPGPAGWPGLVPLTAERTATGKCRGGERGLETKVWSKMRDPKAKIKFKAGWTAVYSIAYNLFIVTPVEYLVFMCRVVYTFMTSHLTLKSKYGPICDTHTHTRVIWHLVMRPLFSSG